MRDKGEPESARFAAISILITDDLLRSAFGTENILSEDNPPNIFLYLRFRRYLIELVHISHDTESVPTGLVYPSKENRLYFLSYAILLL